MQWITQVLALLHHGPLFWAHMPSPPQIPNMVSVIITVYQWIYNILTTGAKSEKNYKDVIFSYVQVFKNKC